MLINNIMSDSKSNDDESILNSNYQNENINCNLTRNNRSKCQL